MTAAVFVALLGAWVLYSGWKFYRQVDWEEPPESTPDLGELHKREAQLLMVQEFLEDAHTQGKLSQAVVEEYHRFCDAELSRLRAVTAKKVIQ